jgi:hypothetical protein
VRFLPSSIGLAAHEAVIAGKGSVRAALISEVATL